MKGVVFLGDRKLELREFPDPTPGPRDVVLEIKASGMCGSDLHMLSSGWGPTPYRELCYTTSKCYHADSSQPVSLATRLSARPYESARM